jgi:hypothetical protein
MARGRTPTGRKCSPEKREANVRFLPHEPASDRPSGVQVPNPDPCATQRARRHLISDIALPKTLKVLHSGFELGLRRKEQPLVAP